MNVGFVGIGRMGEPMAQRLLTAGFQVIAWNRTRGKLDSLIANGARAAASPAEVAAASEAVLTMVLDDAAVESVYTGEQGLLKAGVTGKLFADMSTILPDTVRRVAAAVSECGARFVDAPVAGTVQPARDGRLLIFAGGHPADLERLQPVFRPLARRIDHLGPVGSGAAMKLVHNTLLATYWGVFAEGLAMGSAYGLDLRRMIEVIGESPAAFAALPVKVPLLLGEPAEIGFDISNVRKDLRTIHKFAGTLGVPIHIAEAALENFERAVDGGFGSDDVASIVRIHRRQS